VQGVSIGMSSTPTSARRSIRGPTPGTPGLVLASFPWEWVRGSAGCEVGRGWGRESERDCVRECGREWEWDCVRECGREWEWECGRECGREWGVGVAMREEVSP